MRSTHSAIPSRSGFVRLLPSLAILTLAACSDTEGTSGGLDGAMGGSGGGTAVGPQASGGTAGGGGLMTGTGGATGFGGEAGGTTALGGSTGVTSSTGGSRDAGVVGSGGRVGFGGNAQGGAGTGGTPGTGGTTLVGVDAAVAADSAPAGAETGRDATLTKDVAVVADTGPAKTDAPPASPDGGGECTVSVAGPLGVRAAHSAGYQGTLTAYSDLYNVLCTSIDPCVSSCVAAGGTTASCTAGSECVQGSDKTYCLPPTYWRYEDQATAPDGYTAEQTLVKIAYQDPLLLRDFGIQLPADATIQGIVFEVLRGSDREGVAVDYAVRVLRDGQPTGDDKKQRSGTWSGSLAYVTYGGPTDTWGVSWSPADVMSPQFGLSLAAAYTETAGNARAYVDYARVSIYYAVGCR